MCPARSVEQSQLAKLPACTTAPESVMIRAMSIGFKEWALICAALGTGRQSIILRKGGIAEGREGFRFQHPEFLLFPTLFHEQVAKLKLPPETPLPHILAGHHTLTHRVSVAWTRDLVDWEQISRLEPFHLWTPQVIRERFEYDEHQGISLAFVRVFSLNAPVTFPDEPKYGGCRSWVNVPDCETTLASPVLQDAEHSALEASILAALQ